MRNGIMDCNESLPLITSYHDGELSEAQAAPLRQHLMDCPACRRALAGEKSFARWFSVRDEGPVEVPAGFAQRVARRAFAGDTGTAEDDRADHGMAVAGGPANDENRIFSFVMGATVLAAGLLLVVSGMLFQSHLGAGENLHADGQGLSKSELLRGAYLLADPAGAVGFGETALEDMSDKGLRLPGADQSLKPQDSGETEDR